MKQVPGTELSVEVQRDALARFVHRYTAEHKPAWAYNLNPHKPYRPQFASDADWLANTRFWVRADGSLSERHRYCSSTPTRPFGQE